MTQTTISTTYEADHDRLDGLFTSFRNLKRTDFPKAKEYFKQFKAGLQRHIIWEEEILFPAFEQKTGLSDSGPTHVMRMEHRRIGDLLEAIHEKVKMGDPNSDADEELLLTVLSVHNQKEEGILYPAIDRFLTADERSSVYTLMADLPEERYNTCCHHPHTRSN